MIPKTSETVPATTQRRFLTQSQLSQELQISERTLERMRCDGSGPPFMKAGRRVLYGRQDVDTWLQSQTYSSTAEVRFGPGSSGE